MTVCCLLITGWEAILFLISAAMVMKDCSTFAADLAEVSRNGIPSSSAKALAVHVVASEFLKSPCLSPLSR